MRSSFTNRPAIGAFLPGNSLLHRLHPLTKLAGLLVLSGGVLTAGDYRYAAGAGLLVAAGVIAARIHPRLVWREIRGMAWLLVFVAGGSALAQWSAGKGFSVPGVLERSLFAVKLIVMAAASLVVMHTTAPDAIAAGIPVRLFGSGRAGVLAQKGRLIIMMVLQFTPQLFSEAARLRTVYRMRLAGARRSVPQRLGDLGDLLVSLVSRTLMQNTVLVDSMTMRGFTLDHAGRTSLDDLKLTRTDAVLLATTAAAAGLMIWLNIK